MYIYIYIYQKIDQCICIHISHVGLLFEKHFKTSQLQPHHLMYVQCLVENKLIDQFSETFDTILYLSVLEHIEDDQKEILIALDKLEDKGHLIICVPAHNYMYSNFDKEIGHFRRYEMDFFDKLNLKNANIKKIFS